MRSLLAIASVLAACSGKPRPIDPIDPIDPAEPAPGPAGSAAPTTSGPVDPAATPKLVVLLVIDQLPRWSFDQKRRALTAGFARLLRDGELHTGLHPSIATLTACGHALLGTGEPVSVTGIVGNEWWDRASKQVVRAAQDERGTVSARWLKVPGIADAVAAAGRGGKTVGVALKNRAAVLMLGKSGTAIYYDAKAAAWQSTSTPAKPLPWLAKYAAKHPVSARLDESWTPLDATRLEKLSGVRDKAAGEIGAKGFGATFPHAYRATKHPADAIHASPLGNELTLDLALAAIDGESLGADDVPDYLAVSLSAHDYVGHGWGHESWEAWDMLLRLDQQLATFLAALDTKVGPDGWTMIVTSDHGASPQPVTHGGGSITEESIKDAANRAAITQLGAGDWIAYANYPAVYLSPAALARPQKELSRALVKIVYALRSYPGMSRVELTADIAGNCANRSGDAQVTCFGLDPERSGEVYFHPKQHWIFDEVDERLATAHGSLYAYDREVPVLLLPPGRRAKAVPAKPGAEMPMTRIAPLLASYLGVSPPTTLPR